MSSLNVYPYMLKDNNILDTPMWYSIIILKNVAEADPSLNTEEANTNNDDVIDLYGSDEFFDTLGNV